jgi:oxaloacetate decarboxylase gamma subunit
MQATTMQATIMEQGVDMMIFGMGTVFVFLTVLVIATTLMSALITRYLPEPEPLPVRQPRPATALQQGVDPTTLAVIKAALEQHRRHHKQ